MWSNYLTEVITTSQLGCKEVDITNDINLLEQVVNANTFTIKVKDIATASSSDLIHAFVVLIALHYLSNISYAQHNQVTMIICHHNASEKTIIMKFLYSDCAHCAFRVGHLRTVVEYP